MLSKYIGVNELIGLVYSVNDPAGSGVAKYIIEYYGLEKCDFGFKAIECFVHKKFYLIGFSEDVIYFDFLDKRMPSNTEYYIVLSRHSSAQRIKSYTVHHTGNFGDETPYGGRPRSLAIANPVTTHRLLLNLSKQCEEHGRDNEYEVSYEATHHGPTENNKPLTFIEIGSSIDEWRDKVNHEVLGLAIIEYIEKPYHSCKTVIGIGGGHYPRKHTRLAFEENYCYGHIMAKYALPYLDHNILFMMINRSVPQPKTIVVEKKGTRKEHRNIVEEFSNQEKIYVEYI